MSNQHFLLLEIWKRSLNFCKWRIGVIVIIIKRTKNSWERVISDSLVKLMLESLLNIIKQLLRTHVHFIKYSSLNWLNHGLKSLILCRLKPRTLLRLKSRNIKLRSLLLERLVLWLKRANCIELWLLKWLKRCGLLLKLLRLRLESSCVLWLAWRETWLDFVLV